MRGYSECLVLGLLLGYGVYVRELCDYVDYGDTGAFFRGLLGCSLGVKAGSGGKG